MTTIYLSSTYEDLKDYRKAVFDALRKAGYQVFAMEDYVATDKRPVEKCLEDVAQSDIYVGIFAFRYGYVPPPEHNNPEGLSITELELRKAESLRKPRLNFIAGNDAPLSRKFDDTWTGEANSGAKIRRLREYLSTEYMDSFFTSPDQLAGLVLAALKKEESKASKIGHIEPAEPPPEVSWDIETKGSPFPGLEHFTRKFAPVFFGREAEVRQILDLMFSPKGRFIIISGSSGTGKSSLVHAGVLPKVEESGLPGDKSCLGVRMVPSQGNHPFDALLRALHPHAEAAGLNPFGLGEELAAQPKTFTNNIQTILSKGLDADALVLFLDQMEELYTARAGQQTKEHTAAFVSGLYHAVYESHCCAERVRDGGDIQYRCGRAERRLHRMGQRGGCERRNGG